MSDNTSNTNNTNNPPSNNSANNNNNTTHHDNGPSAEEQISGLKRQVRILQDQLLGIDNNNNNSNNNQRTRSPITTIFADYFIGGASRWSAKLFSLSHSNIYSETVGTSTNYYLSDPNGTFVR